MYFIPKDVRVKKEIFKGYGVIEMIIMIGSISLGYLLQSMVTDSNAKLFLFILLPLLTFFLLLPLPSGNALSILKKYLKFRKRQKIYKL